MSSRVRSIVGAIKTALAALSDTTVLYQRPRPEDGALPSIYVFNSTGTSDHGEALTDYQRTWTFDIEGRISPTEQTCEERELAAADLLDDLMAALETDRTLGGLVETLVVTGTNFDGDSVGLGQLGVVYAQIVVTFQITAGEGT